MSTSASIPGLYYAFAGAPPEKSPLRTDVAGFFGFTRRGPCGEAVRVDGWREFANVFGGLAADSMTSYAVRGYFENMATTAYVVRLLGAGAAAATATWAAGNVDAATRKPDANWPGQSRLPALTFAVKASSPGDWANGMYVTVRYWARAASGNPELEVEVVPPDESPEILSGVHPEKIVEEVNARSLYIRLAADPLPGALTAADLTGPPGPRHYEWSPVTLNGAISKPPTLQHYLDAVTALGDEAEVALVISPDLFDTALDFPDDQKTVIDALLRQAAALHDRLVILDVPPQKSNPICALAWLADLRKAFPDERLLQNAAVYHPPLLVPDPLGDVTSPQRTVLNSGLVAGVVSRLDRQLGPYATPANAPIYEAVDLTHRFDAEDQGVLYQGGINLLKCTPGKGLMVWGGRVLGLGLASIPASGVARDYRGGFVAHRRLIHTLVRAIRRVAEPLVFDANGPQLWLALVRSITSVLLEAYRAGALKGATPQEAFQVKCDSETNPPENIDNGLCICLVQVAPAAPMEFITLRIAVSGEGTLEVTAQ